MSGKAQWDLIAAGLLLALAVFVLVRTSIGFGAPFADAGGIFPETLPRVYGVALLVLALILGVEAWNRRNDPPAGTGTGEDASADASEEDSPFSSSLPWGRLLGTLAAVVVYAIVLPMAPFLPITAAFLASLFFLYGHRNYVSLGLVALIGALAMDVLFIRILSLPL